MYLKNEIKSWKNLNSNINIQNQFNNYQRSKELPEKFKNQIQDQIWTNHPQNLKQIKI